MFKLVNFTDISHDFQKQIVLMAIDRYSVGVENCVYNVVQSIIHILR